MAMTDERSETAAAARSSVTVYAVPSGPGPKCNSVTAARNSQILEPVAVKQLRHHRNNFTLREVEELLLFLVLQQ